MADSRSRPSPDLAGVVESGLRGWLDPGRHLCVALSGGRDSVALLHLVVGVAPRLGIAVSAVHVDHGLSPNAGRWAAFCRDLCAGFGVPCQIVRVSIAPQAGEGLEAAARRERYTVFGECDSDAVAVAHHAGDQAETLLFRLLRGTGVTGAAGMPAQRPLLATDGRQRHLLRPLLNVLPDDLAAYVRTHRLAFVDDESNADPAYARNYLRHAVLAPLEQRFPGAGTRLARATGRFREADGLLDALAEIDRQSCAGGRGLSLAGLRDLPAARQRNLLHFWLRQAGLGIPSAAWLEGLRRQLAAARDDAQTQVGVGATDVRTWRGEVVLVAHRVGRPPAALRWSGESRLGWQGGEVGFALTAGGGIAAARLHGRTLQLKPRVGGERLQPDAGRPRRSLKLWLQEAGVPPWERRHMPCLWCDDELIWVPGVGVAAAFAARAREPAWQVVWTPAVTADYAVDASSTPAGAGTMKTKAGTSRDP